MQQYNNHRVSWTQRMGVKLNQDKVDLLHLGQTNQKRSYTLGEGGPPIKVVDQDKDLGVLISSDLKPDLVETVSDLCQAIAPICK